MTSHQASFAVDTSVLVDRLDKYVLYPKHLGIDASTITKQIKTFIDAFESGEAMPDFEYVSCDYIFPQTDEERDRLGKCYIQDIAAIAHYYKHYGETRLLPIVIQWRRRDHSPIMSSYGNKFVAAMIYLEQPFFHARLSDYSLVPADMTPILYKETKV